MDNVSALVYYNDDMIPTDKGIVFECLTDPKVILITEDMLFAALRKAIFDAKRRLQNFNKCFLLSTKLRR